MSVELGCTCDDLPAHSHVFRHEPMLVDGVKTIVAADTGEIRIWVDWKAVARDLALPAPPEVVVQRAGPPLGLVVDGVPMSVPFEEADWWYTVHDWTGRKIFDGPGPVPQELITLTARDIAEGRVFTFDARPLADSDRVIAALGETLTRPRRHDQCDTEHPPGECLVHDKRAKNCRYDDVPAEFRLIIEGRWCEPCMREAAEEANPMTDTPVEIAAESQRRFAEDPTFQARATAIDGIVVESVQRIFGRTLSDGERDAARFAIAVSLVVAEKET